MNAQFKKGVLDLVVMVVVSQHDIYGYELVKRVCEVVEVNEGTIYPLLKRMTNEKYFESTWSNPQKAPPRKYYRITALGLTTMNQLKTEWLAFSKQLNLFHGRGNSR